jgi:hypothetical protein
MLTVNDLVRTKHQELVDLWKQLPPPDFEEMNGEYLARPVDSGMSRPKRLATLLAVNFQGDWLGKAFYPTSDNRGSGYNSVFETNSGQIRTLSMKTHLGESNISTGQSFFVDYSAGRTGRSATGRDEIRKVDDELYLGFGYYLRDSGQIKQLYGFVLEGPSHPFDTSMLNTAGTRS